jgi:hypothetical protein
MEVSFFGKVTMPNHCLLNHLRQVIRRFVAAPATGLAVLLLIAAGCGGSGGLGPTIPDVDLLYEETFDALPDGPLPTGWQVITQQAATLEGPADWKIRSRRLHQASNVRAPNTTGSSYALDYEGTMALVGDSTWVNIRFRVDLIPRDDDGIGVIFRWRPSATDDDGNFYRMLMVTDTASGGPRLRVDKRIDGEWTILGEKEPPAFRGYEPNRRYTIEVDMVATDFTVKIDGAIQFEFTDSSLGAGRIGLFCYAQQGADFDNIRVVRRGP